MSVVEPIECGARERGLELHMGEAPPIRDAHQAAARLVAAGLDAYAWLVYLSFFIVYAVWANSPREWLIDGPALALFLVLYFRGFWLEGRPLLGVIFGIVCIGMVVAPRNPGASCFFIYAAAFVGAVGRPAVAVRWLLVILAVVAAETLFFSLSPPFWGRRLSCRSWSAARTSISVKCGGRIARSSRPMKRPSRWRHRRARANRSRPARSSWPHALNHRLEV